MMVKVVALITGVLGIINISLDIHSKVKKLQQNKKRSRNKRKRK
ncbi:hypothetical protein BG10_6704 [Bacillus thuringiensis serovar morrisoni]|nr:hypothetical protein BG10_6704 [Bacillus thuringiensis serovar morrisoni]